MNLVILSGRLGKDPELRTTTGGASYVRFSLATNETYKDNQGQYQERTEWHNILIWRKLAEAAHKILQKGNLIELQGKLQTTKFTDNDGIKKSFTEVVVYSFNKLQGKKEGAPPPEEPFNQDPTEEDSANDDLPF